MPAASMRAPNPEVHRRELELRRQFKDDFPLYAARCLKIRTKQGSVVALELNEAQWHIHRLLEKQKKRTGKVRVLILKGRQQGSSTYVEARFYHNVTHRFGVRAFILTHKDEATKNLFEMSDRFHKHCPALLKPSTGASNAKELYFDRLDSGYQVGTARSEGTGRSATLQYFHGSEVAYWRNANDHIAGVMQAVPDEPGTEIILESTSAGASGEFYRLCREAWNGEGEYQLIFVPWFWQQEYQAEVPENFERTSDEEALTTKHGLTDAQLVWRREKIRQLGSVYKFRLEYPLTVGEAFAVERAGALWSRSSLDETRVDSPPALLRRVVGVDPPAEQAECGIVPAGLSRSKELYALGDTSTPGAPEVWAARVVSTYVDFNCDAIVVEVNQGGEMAASVIRTAWKTRFGNERAPIIKVRASKGKQARAEPISLLWTEAGQLAGHVVGRLVALEDELCTWEPNSGMSSPNRLDAFVWAAVDLLNQGATGVPAALEGASPGGGWGGGAGDLTQEEALVGLDDPAPGGGWGGFTVD